MRRINVPLRDPTYQELRDLAYAEDRDLREQAAVLIESALQAQRGRDPRTGRYLPKPKADGR